jgi:hypothetical protein
MQPLICQGPAQDCLSFRIVFEAHETVHCFFVKRFRSSWAFKGVLRRWLFNCSWVRERRGYIRGACSSLLVFNAGGRVWRWKFRKDIRINKEAKLPVLVRLQPKWIEASPGLGGSWLLLDPVQSLLIHESIETGFLSFWEKTVCKVIWEWKSWVFENTSLRVFLLDLFYLWVGKYEFNIFES